MKQQLKLKIQDQNAPLQRLTQIKRLVIAETKVVVDSALGKQQTAVSWHNEKKIKINRHRQNFPISCSVPLKSEMRTQRITFYRQRKEV